MSPVVLPAGLPGPDGRVFSFPVHADAFDLLFGQDAAPPRPTDRPADPRARAIALKFWQSRGITPPWADVDLTPLEKLARRIDQLAADMEELAAAVVRLEGYKLAA